MKFTGASVSCGAIVFNVSRTPKPLRSLSSESWSTTRSDDELLDDPGARAQPGPVGPPYRTSCVYPATRNVYAV